MEREAPAPLNHTPTDGPTRAAALAAVEAVECRSTPVVTYESGGTLAIVGPESAVLRAADSLGGDLDCTLVVTEPAGPDRPAGRVSSQATLDAVQGGIAIFNRGTRLKMKASEHRQVPIRQSQSPGMDFCDTLTSGKSGDHPLIYAPVAHIRGYLGRFEVMLVGPDGPVGLSAVTVGGRPWVDMVLDLTTPGFMTHEQPPVGYYAPADDPAALKRALAELPELVGRFEKPKFFDYDPALCAHGRSGIRVCTRCLDTCPAGAIRPHGERVEINPNLCQGAGSCATACPTGAITYAYPRLGDTLERLRAALGAYRKAGGDRPAVLFHDAAAGQEGSATFLLFQNFRQERRTHNDSRIIR